jgi:CubicO group peptidase (beta-lactamase class C family)
LNVKHLLYLAWPLLLAAPMSFASAPSLADNSELRAWVDEFVAHQMKENHIPGAIVCIVKDGQIILSKGYGLADIEAQRAVDPHKTLFRIASVTKMFTATAILQQVERGNLHLESDVREIVDFPLRLSSSKPLRVSDLLTHRGGFENGLFGVLSNRMTQMPSLKEVLSRTMPSQVRDPGTLSSYSNHGFTLLAYVLERRTGIPMAQYLQDNIFKPLGMESTSFLQPLPPPLKDEVATGYSYTNGQLIPHPFEIVLTAGGGAISSTADDMGRFMLAQLQLGLLDGRRILSVDSTQDMHNVHFRYAPGPGGMGYGFPHAEINGHDVLWHTGALYYCYSRLVLIPDSGVGLFIAGNSDQADELQERLFAAFMERYFPPPAPTSAMSGALQTPDRREADEISGEYRRSGFPITTFAALTSLKEIATVRATNEGMLVQRGGGKTINYRYVGPSRYRTTDSDQSSLGDVVFFRDVNGKVAGYSVQNRETSSMERVTNPFRTPWLTVLLARLVYGIASMGLIASVLIAFRWRRLTRSWRWSIVLIMLSSFGAWTLFWQLPWLANFVREELDWVPARLTLFLTTTSALAVLSASAAIVTLRAALFTPTRVAWRAAAVIWSIGALGGSCLLVFWHLFGYRYY